MGFPSSSPVTRRFSSPSTSRSPEGSGLSTSSARKEVWLRTARALVAPLRTTGL
jgi:hypothetical protein